MEYQSKKYQIWIGYYNFGQGHVAPTEPQMVAEIEAQNFKMACFIYELKHLLKTIEFHIERNYFIAPYWQYNAHLNDNMWTGKYFETKEEAQKTFETLR